MPYKKPKESLQRPLPGIGPGDGKGHLTGWPTPPALKRQPDKEHATKTPDYIDDALMSPKDFEENPT